MSSWFRSNAVSGADLYLAAKEVCSRLYIALGGSCRDEWSVRPYPGTAALSASNDTYANIRRFTLYMPAIPMDAFISRHEADCIMSYVTHEVTHAVYTDYAAWDRGVALGLSVLVNGLEDIRCEHRLTTDA